MKQQNFSVSPFWDSRALDSKTKLSRIMVTVNIAGQSQFRISVKLKSTKEDFEKATSSARVLSDAAKMIRKDLNDYLQKAEIILERLQNPTKETFTRLFKSSTDLFLSSKTDIRILFEQKVADLHKERFSSSSNCKLAITSLHKYKSPLYFEDIDTKFLKGYVQWMISQGNSITTAQIYLRQLRSVFNDAIKAGYISERHYPFKGFSMGGKVKSKSVLYPVQLKELLAYKTAGIRETRAKAYFFFCYLSNGMNFRDLAMLKWKNVHGNMITFVRHKTRNTTTNGQKEIKVYLHDLSKAIIKEWGNKNTQPDDFVFPICDNKMSAEHIDKTITRYKRISNKFLAPIGKKLGFEVHLCLNLARHSFATKLKIDNKVSLAAISDAMGHTTTTTTMHYMKSLPDEMIKEMSLHLLEFDPQKK
ncbi:tyrosine-type recombinase/integrase [Segetibacter aerophilus]|uniref:Integrase n=1 Tax=Segetibacter aerophilus TaxID=670293 RepID=A0A512B8L2_9BACT|nr:site-specific integrase [Segetibacter aerophilus]GEO08302.1 integrase [Segetibacter aerophilus]